MTSEIKQLYELVKQLQDTQFKLADQIRDLKNQLHKHKLHDHDDYRMA